MGVLYRHGNVVRSLLVPYLRDHGCSRSESEILQTYHLCTLGKIATHDLWNRLGAGASATDADYCTRHELNPGVTSTLERLTAAGITPVVLTNDAAAWSEFLRRRFDLEQYVERWYVSSDIGARKPSADAYRAVLAHPGLDPARTVFVDDRPANLLGARAAGFQPLLFHSDDSAANAVDGFTPTEVRSMSELATQLV